MSNKTNHQNTSGNDISTLPKWAQEHITKIESDKENYKTGMLKYKKDTKDVSIKAEEYLNDLKRTQADFENYKKRQVIQQKELGGYLIEKLLLDIIPVLDNFRQATMHVPPEQKDSPWVTGIQYIEKQLEDAIKTNGVEVIEVKEEDTFDPQIHEAVSSEGTGGSELVEEAVSREKESSKKQETAGGPEPVEGKGNTIAKVLQKGFKVGDRVVRPAKVVTR